MKYGHRFGRRAALGMLGASMALARPALAQGKFPSRPITIVVPIPAGGGTDYAARLIAEPMGVLLGQPVVVENRPGGNDVVGVTSVLRAPQDGYTLLMGYCGTMAGRAAIGGLTRQGRSRWCRSYQARTRSAGAAARWAWVMICLNGVEAPITGRAIRDLQGALRRKQEYFPQADGVIGRKTR